MITESILIVFAIVYYIFSEVFCYEFIRDYANKCNTIKKVAIWIGTVYFSWFVAPFIIAYEFANAIKEN